MGKPFLFYAGLLLHIMLHKEIDMSGHSKWATIKHKKGAADAARGRLFSRLVREIIVAAKAGGGSIDTNARLRTVIQKAKDASMPSDNIDRAIKKGTGELPGIVYEEITYEGYGPGGVAILVEALSDNKNRTTSEVRNVFEKRGGSMAGQGAVSWQFHKKGYFAVSKAKADEDKLMSLVLDAGAQDMASSGEIFEITTDPKDFEAVKKAIESAKIPVDSCEVTMIPQATVKVEGPSAKSVLQLVEGLEDLEDVQHVFANFEISDEELKAAA